MMCRGAKVFNWLLIAFMVVASLPAYHAAAQAGSTCGAQVNYPSACREYLPTSDPRAGEPSLFRFMVTLLPSEDLAHLQVLEYGETLPGHPSGYPGFNFGDEQFAFWDEQVAPGDEPHARVAFRIGTTLMVWSVSGVIDEPFDILHDIYERMDLDSQPQAIGAREQLLRFLPDDSGLPAGFALDEEEIRDVPSGTPPEFSDEELQATIEAYERKLDETSQPSGPSRASSSGQLEIGSITAKDAGIGNGTIYVYVEVTNNSNSLYPYVGLEGTCRSTSGSVIGTGYGNAANVAAGETAVIPMLFLSVPGCDSVEVGFDALTGVQ